MIDAVEQKVAQFKERVSPGSIFLSSERHIDELDALLPYAHYLHQAWRALDLKGVLCVDGKPVSYICGAQSFTRKKKKEQHRFVWNQGLVPLLMFVTPESVEVHSAIKKPESEEKQLSLVPNDLPSLIPVLDTVAETLSLARLVRSIETGQFFQDNSVFFPANETVDRCLLRQLVQTARELKKKNWTLAQAHALLGRALFVSFLDAREFIKPRDYPEGTASLLDILNRSNHQEVKRLLYKEFFPRLRREFNGTMFDTALDDEERNIEKSHLDILALFLGKHDVASRQMSLGFDDYDFRFIPVEIISAIYEEFMKGTDPDKQRNEGAYYTPRHLAETVLHVALDGRYAEVLRWKVLDPACGSGIFLVAMFNLIAEQWKRANGSRSRRQTKAQALMEILQTQIRGVDSNPEACRITAFSLYLALFEKLQPMDVDEFKEKVRKGPFLPSLLWTKQDAIEKPVVMHGDFLEDRLPLSNDIDLIIGNPPWESRGKKQIALRFVDRSVHFIRPDGLGCLLLPSPVLVNRHGSLDLEWFKSVTAEKIVQLADFRYVLFEATHPCFILRYRNAKPTLDNIVAYETPKLNRFDRRQGVIVVEPDDHKFVSQRDIVEAGLCDRLQALWSRKFWGTPRDESFLRRMDSFPKVADLVEAKRFREGVGFQPFYPGVSNATPKPLKPWNLSDNYLANDANFPQLTLQTDDFQSLREGLENSVYQRRGQQDVPASLELLRRKPKESVFTPPMMIFSKGFTKFVFSAHKVRFFDGLRSITGDDTDADLLRFLTAFFASNLSKYLTFHAGSNFGVGRDQLHVYESLNPPFLLPDHELAPKGAAEIVREAAKIIKTIERRGENASADRREIVLLEAKHRLEPLVEAYFNVSDEERILIEDTLAISQPSIHQHGLDGNIPSLAFPDASERKLYGDTLCATLNRYVRKQGIKISARGMAVQEFNLIFMTVIFGAEKRPYGEATGQDKLWAALARLDKAAKHENGPFSYLRGFSYFEQDRLHMLKPAVLRSWSRTAALNDADAIFEHLTEQDA